MNMLNDKIRDLLLHKNLTPSRFADEIGVQRSSISHILSGRNRPSLEIVQKIMKRFPDLGTDWLLEEAAPVKPTTADRRLFVAPEKSEVAPAVVAANREETDKPETDLSFLKSTKRIERILVFYTDNTFGEFIPNDGKMAG